ncbi:MAG: hypothetical protein MN733_24810, partial [Nitrososphaera sp.]|nr:hypothetical protein [Nitrososphaera sp.]
DNRSFLWLVHEANEATVPRVNWTEIHDVNHLSPITGAESQWRSDAFETTASGSWSTGVKFGAIAFEIKAFVAPTPPPPPPPDPIPPPTCEEDLATVVQDLEEALERVDTLMGLVDEATTNIIALEAELALKNDQISALESDLGLKNNEINALEAALVLRDDKLAQIAVLLEQMETILSA